MNTEATLSPVQQAYPDRYYAQYDPKATQPAPVLGWYNMWEFSDLDGLPPLSQLLPLSETFWAEHIASAQTSRAVQDGKIVTYTPPPPPLKERAQTAMQTVQQQASMASAMGETFGPQMQAYVKQLRAIISGSDTTSTELPQAPDEVSS